MLEACRLKAWRVCVLQGCNTEAVRTLLGDRELSDVNMLAHLGVIEQRSNELLQVSDWLHPVRVLYATSATDCDTAAASSQRQAHRPDCTCPCVPPFPLYSAGLCPQQAGSARAGRVAACTAGAACVRLQGGCGAALHPGAPTGATRGKWPLVDGWRERSSDRGAAGRGGVCWHGWCSSGGRSRSRRGSCC